MMISYENLKNHKVALQCTYTVLVDIGMYNVWYTLQICYSEQQSKNK